MFLKIIPYILSCILISAHFLRNGNAPLTVISLLFPFLLLIKKRWSFMVSQLFAYFSITVWIYTMFNLANERIKLGMPYGKLIIIFSIVIVFTFLSSLLLLSPDIKKKYKK